MKGKQRRKYRPITPEKRRQIIKMASTGATYRQIVDAVDVSVGAVAIVLVPLGGVHRKEMWAPAPGWLSLDERVEIRLGLERNESVRAIARRLDRHPSTVSREVTANGGAATTGRWRRIDAPINGRAGPRRPSSP